MSASSIYVDDPIAADPWEIDLSGVPDRVSTSNTDGYASTTSWLIAQSGDPPVRVCRRSLQPHLPERLDMCADTLTAVRRDIT